MGKIEKHKSVKGERGFVKSRHVIFWGLGFFEKGEGQKNLHLKFVKFDSIGETL